MFDRLGNLLCIGRILSKFLSYFLFLFFFCARFFSVNLTQTILIAYISLFRMFD